MNKRKSILITGGAGFIGFQLWQLLKTEYNIVVIDNLARFSNYKIKMQRISSIGLNANEFESNSKHQVNSDYFYFADINNPDLLEKIFSAHEISAIIHLAAATGVRLSITRPEIYTESNIIGFNNILKACEENGIKNIIYASSSSVYGDDSPIPFKEDAPCNNPLSYYAVTKKNNELTAESYFKNFKLNIIGLRFFTVYGPWGRPDMANYIFMNSIINEEEILLYNNGEYKRDFTFVEDITYSIKLLLEKMLSGHKYKNEIFNIGKGETITVNDYLKLIENTLGKKAIIKNMKASKEEMIITLCDNNKLLKEINYIPKVDIEKGVALSAKWFKKHKKLLK